MLKNYLLVITIVLFFLLTDMVTVIENYTICNMPHLVLSKKEIIQLKELLDEFVTFSDRNHVNYFLIGGSLLGSDRNGGLMPFDDDIDIGVCEEDRSKIKEYTHNHFYFEEISFGYKFKKRNERVFIDIMIYENVDGVYRIINNHWPNDYFSEKDLFPLKKILYSERYLNVPNFHKTYLERYYPDYENTIKIDCGHYDSQCIYDKHNIPKEFKVDYENYKYLCYTKLG